MTRRTFLARLLLATTLAALAVEAFVPFRLDVPGYRANGARRTSDGIVFDGPSRASTPSAPAWVDEARAGASFEIVLVATVSGRSTPVVERLFTISSDVDNANVMIAQYEEDLIVRVRRAGSDASGEPPARVSGVFGDRRARRITVRREGSAVEVAVDGRREEILPLGDAGLSRWRTTFRVALGDEHGGGRAWHGTLHTASVAVGDRRWDYLADVELPRRFWYLPNRVRDLVAIDGGMDVAVSIAHGASFLPAGALLLTSDRRRRRSRAVRLAALASLVLQIGKVGFAGRHPSVVDLVTQALGGGLGVMAAGWFLANGGRREAPRRAEPNAAASS